MAEDTTKLTIDIVTLLKGLDKTLAGLAKVESQLKRVAAVRVTGQTAAGGFDRATAAARRLEIQQGRLNVQAQRLANQQERVNQTSVRLALSQQRLATAEERVARSTGAQADAHVKAFRNIEGAAKKAQQEAVVAFGLTNKQLLTFGNAARSIGQGLTSLGATLTATLTVPLTALGITSVNAAVQLDSLKRGLTAIVGSSAEAGRQLTRLTEIAKLPGIGFEEAIQGSIRLQAVGFSALDAERALKQFSNAVALTGGGRDELARITVQLGQLAAKGKVLSQDLRPIIEAAPAVGRALKQAFGTVNADDIAELSGSSREFLDILVAELERLPRAAAGAKNAFENFRDTVFRAAAAIGEALLPALTKLVELVGPVITVVAEGFSRLPVPLQAAVVGMTALLAAAGPLTFIIGALVLGVARLAVGIAQVNAQLPAAATGMFGLATGANAATGAMATLRVAVIGTTAALAGLVGLIVQVVAAYVIYNKLTEATRDITDEQLTITKDQVDSLKDQLTFIDKLKDGVARTADEQQRLLEIYRSLNSDAQERVGGIRNETVETAKLRAEVERLLQLRLQEREQQTATIAGSLADTLKLIEARKQESDAITDQIAKNTALIAVQRANTDQNDNSILRVNELSAANRDLLAAQNELSDENKKSIETARNLARQLIALGVTSTDQIRNVLALRQAMGLFEGSIDDAVPILKTFIDGLNQTTDAARRLKGELSGIDALLKQSSDSSEQLQKNRQELIKRNAIIAREFGRNFDEARKAMEVFIAKQPELRQAIQREAEIEGVTIAEVINKALGGATKDRGQALRNAQEQLNDAMDRLAQEAAENTIATEKSKNDQLLRINELRFRRELISFREFIVERARLQRQEIQGDIDRQRKIAELAAGDVERARARVGTTTGAEQTKARADEQRALAEKVQAETKVIELLSRQRDIFAETAGDLDQFTQERLRSFRELKRELDEIVGREQEAAEAAIDERFADQLRTLRNELKLAGRDLIAAQAVGNQAAAKQAAATAEQLRGQVTVIENHKRILKAVAEVQQVQEEIRRVEEQQANLERQLAFEVEFRGLAEEEAIRRRLEGEAKVRDAIDAQRVRLEVLAETLKKAGIEIPLVLAEAIERLRVSSLGLGELDFVEQFRLGQKEFDRLNDLRIRKIQEVEAAVAHRDISELQGRLLVRQANEDYAAELERQAAILEKVAKASKDQGLLQQAADMRQLAIETRNAATEVADLSTELQSATVDELRDAFAGMGRTLVDIARGAVSAKDALLDMLDRVAGRLTDIVFDRLADKAFAGLLNLGQETPGVGGLGGAIAGGAAQAGGLGSAVGQAGAAALTTAGTTAAAALTTGGASAGAALVTAATTAATAFLSGVTGAAAGFAATIAAAGAAFAATVGVAGASQAASGIAGGLSGVGAATGLYPATPGGVVRIVEGGYPEAVLTTDPKHATRQLAILREYLKQTRGLFGRIKMPELAIGGMVSAADVEAGLLRSLGSSRLGVPTPSDGLQLQSAGGELNLRINNLLDRDRMAGELMRSATGEKTLLNFISANRDEIGRRIGVNRR